MSTSPALSGLSRQQLADLGREYMLFAFLLTRAGLAQVALRFGQQAHERIAILEWMGASPIYTQRMQRALGFGGDDMATIFKGLQLDVGFTHQYMDVGYRLIDPQHGEFWLNSCGALLDVEPMGEKLVVSMCHHIEDPTFDATAVATNPHARIRPVHRPPRRPAERVPHCYWTVTIDPAVEPVVEDELTTRLRRSKLAVLETTDPAPASEAGGWPGYAGAFDPDFQLEALDQPSLVRALTEFVIQSHLLVRAMSLAIGDQYGIDAATDHAVDMWIGANWVGSERLRAALDLPAGIDGIVRALPFHPAFPPDYAPLRVDVTDDARVRISLPADCPAVTEGDHASWFALLAAGELGPLDALVKGVDRRARVEPAGPLAWDVVVDPAAAPADETDAVALTRVGACADFTFERRRPLEGVAAT
jgi:hypothetical protein